MALAACSPALADAPPARYAGAWRIADASLAPWATPEQGFPEEVKRLLGKRVRFAAAAVSGPAPLACARPSYRVRPADGPETLFEGGLNDPPGADPATRARRLGMTTATVPTLEVGCSEIAYHAFAPGVLVFALDNQIYTLRR